MNIVGVLPDSSRPESHISHDHALRNEHGIFKIPSFFYYFRKRCRTQPILGRPGTPPWPLARHCISSTFGASIASVAKCIFRNVWFYHGKHNNCEKRVASPSVWLFPFVILLLGKLMITKTQCLLNFKSVLLASVRVIIPLDHGIASWSLFATAQQNC